MLGGRTNPDHSQQDVWLQQAAQRMGVGETFAATPQGIDCEACVRCGQCLAGCPYGAKSSMDATYLGRAEQREVQVRTRSRAEILVPLGPQRDGGAGWRIVISDPLARRARPRSISAGEVVLAVGVLGTTELLLASRDRWHTLPHLSDMVGRAVRTNSEAFTAIVHPPGTDISHGTAISCDFYPDVGTHGTNNRLPASYRSLRFSLGGNVRGQSPGERRAAAMRQILLRPWDAFAPARVDQWHRWTTVLTVMQSRDSELQVRYRRRPWGWSLVSQRPAGAEPVPAYLPQAEAAGRAVAEATEGTSYTTLAETLLATGATAHILGGAVIAANPATASWMATTGSSATAVDGCSTAQPYRATWASTPR